MKRYYVINPNPGSHRYLTRIELTVQDKFNFPNHSLAIYCYRRDEALWLEKLHAKALADITGGTIEQIPEHILARGRDLLK